MNCFDFVEKNGKFIIKADAHLLKKMNEDFGTENQLDKLKEECAECISILDKLKTDKDVNFIEEVVDVLFMSAQIIYKYQNDAKLEFNNKNKKILKKLNLYEE